jgi:hypothetical protein
MEWNHAHKFWTKPKKRSECEQVEWGSTRFIQACVVQAYEWGTNRVKQPYKQQKG